MSKIVLVQKKGCLDRFKYIELSDLEKDIQKGDLVNHSDSDSFKEYEFVAWVQELGSRYAFCRDGILNRYMYEDSIKKSSRSIKENKILTKKLKKSAKVKKTKGNNSNP
jgi:hypothetical protein